MIRTLSIVAGAIGVALAGLILYVQMAFPAARPNATVLREPAPDALLAELKPRKRAWPLVAVVAQNSGTETTDFLIPIGVMRRTGVADVFSVAVAPGPVQLMPALRVEADTTLAQFDVQFPDGADIVIVPAVHDSQDAALIAWIKAQAERGAIVASICEGANVVANAGLFDGKRATTHWYRFPGLMRDHPDIVPVRDARYVADKGVAATSGVSASLPFSLALVAAIAGRERAEAAAADLGVSYWGPSHASDAFIATQSTAFTFILNKLTPWRYVAYSIFPANGIDEISLALTADAYSRTGLSGVSVFTPGRHAVTSKSGVKLISEADGGSGFRPLPFDGGVTPGRALDSALAGIQQRFGAGTADYVRLQLEYPAP